MCFRAECTSIEIRDSERRRGVCPCFSVPGLGRDDGIQAQTLLLGAVERGRGGCVIKAFKNESLRQILALPSYLKIMYVIALGTPVERVVLEDMKDGDYKYWRDAEGVHHVPKRKLEELIVR